MQLLCLQASNHFFGGFRDVIVKLPLGLKILRNQFHAPQAHVVVGGSGGIPPP